MGLSQSELERYDRQLRIPGWGLHAQRRLKESKVAVVGIGGLGCLASTYLAAVGVGRLILVDMGRFELSNLNRQVLGYQRDIGRFKSLVAQEKLKELNPDIEVEAAVMEIGESNVSEVIGDADVVVDGMDNWRTRFILNRYCVRRRIPFVHAGISEMYGQITTIVPYKGPCLRCIFPRNPLEVERIPVFGAIPAMMASMQVVETVKLITGLGNPLVGRLLFVDGYEMSFNIIQVVRREDCPICGVKPT